MVGIYTNRIRFDPEAFGEESIVKESEFLWNNLSTQV